MIFHRGKYQGQAVDSVPSRYLVFVIEHPEATRILKEECKRVLAGRLGIEPQIIYRTEYKTAFGSTSVLDRDKLQKWYRRAALAAHPDRGGSVEMMKLLNELMEL